MELELKYIAPYLPYGLKIQGQTNKEVAELTAIKDGGVQINDNKITYGWWSDFFDIKLILHPLSDITKEIEVNGEKFVPIDFLVDKMKLTIGGLSKFGITKRILNEPFTIDYWAFEKLLSWHFDVFSLINDGLAIDINTF